MSDTKGTSKSNLGPFETYRTSLREMKEEAAQARKTADALDKLEEAIPQWGQMCELTARNVPYEPIQTWQEQAREVLESVQSDFSSGTVSRVQKGTEKINTSISELKRIKKKLKNKIDKKEEKIDEEKSKKSKIKNNLEKSEKSIAKKKISLRNKATVFAIAAFIVGSIGGCAFGAVGPSQPSGIYGLIFGFPSSVIVWVLTYFVGKSNIGEEKIGELKKNKNKKEGYIVNMEEEVSELKNVLSKVDIRT